MDQNSFNSHLTRSTFFSRVYATQPPSNSPTSYLSIPRSRASTPSFFGKSQIQQSAGRDSEFQTTSAVHPDGDGSASLPHRGIEDGSIYAGRRRHGDFSRSIEDTNNWQPGYDNVDGVSHVPHPPRLNPSFATTQAGVRETFTQNLSSEDFTGDFKQKTDVKVGPTPLRRADAPHGEIALFAGPRNTNPDPALTPLGHPVDLGCAAPDSGSSTRITPKAEEGEEDDIPFSIKQSFKELRSVKDELERQRGENQRLRAELAVAQKKASDGLARLNKTKLMAKRSIESASNALVELRKELALLKSQSDESFAFAAQARSALPDISDLRVAINKNSENCRRIVEDLGKATEMKGLIRDLESECANARKVNDFLRDKLTDVTSQYADATERLQSEGRTNAKQTDALRVALGDLHNANLLAAARTAKLDATQKELNDTLTAYALAMENILQLEKRGEKLARDAEEKALVAATLQKENAELHALLTDRESSTSSMLSLKEEILAMLSSSSDQRPELDSLRKTSAEQLQTIGELNGRYHTLERESEVRKQELANQISENAALRADLEAANDQGRLLSELIERLKTEKLAVETQSQTLRDELRRIAEERKQENDRMTQLQMRCHALQERFEDQSATLKLTRESHGDIQERLIAAETAFVVKLESETGKLRQEVFSIEERNGFLQRSVDEHKRQLEEQKDIMRAMRNEYEKRLEDARDGSNSRIQALQERMFHAGSEKAQAVKEADGLRDSLTTAQSELMKLREQVQNIQPISELDDKVKDLAARNHALQEENVILLERGNTIGARYDANDLSVEEKILVNHIQEESRCFHEKRILDKQNELRRRDNQVAEQEARIKSLEKSLARYLKSQDLQFTAGNDAHSILNLSRFTLSSSPPQLMAGEVDVVKVTLINGTCTTPMPGHSLQTSSELFKGPSDVVNSPFAAAPSGLSSDREGGTTFSRVSQGTLGDDLPSNASGTVKLGKHGRPGSQTSHQGSEKGGDSTKPQKRLKSSRKQGRQASELKAEPDPKPRSRKRK